MIGCKTLQDERKSEKLKLDVIDNLVACLWFVYDFLPVKRSW